jgi:mannose-6-phosphate isomerase-like protein (cupin superfamily)
MGYHVIDPDDVEPAPDRPSEMRYVSEAAGMSRMGLRLYRVESGEDVPLSGLHYHDEQEEAFYVVEGELHVETPNREYAVESGQFFVAEPESPHRAFNPASSEETAVVVAVGAPPVSDGHAYDP